MLSLSGAGIKRQPLLQLEAIRWQITTPDHGLKTECMTPSGAKAQSIKHYLKR